MHPLFRRPPHPVRAERKSKLRQAQGDAKKEIDEFKAQREARLRTVQPEAEALAAKVARLASETDRKISALEAEYQRNKEIALQMLMEIVMSINNPNAAKYGVQVGVVDVAGAGDDGRGGCEGGCRGR